MVAAFFVRGLAALLTLRVMKRGLLCLAYAAGCETWAVCLAYAAGYDRWHLSPAFLRLQPAERRHRRFRLIARP